MEKSKKIALFTCHDDPNYGSMLQAYALGVAIKKLGHHVEYITYRVYPKQNKFMKFVKYIVKSCLRITGIRKEENPFNFFYTKPFFSTLDAFTSFHKKYIPATSKIYYSNTISKELKLKEYGNYIVGSDQLWSPFTYECDCRHPYFLDFADFPVRNSYGTSLGTTHFSDEYKQILKDKLAAFKHISCRELSNSTMLTKLLGRPVEHVLDPTLLLSLSDWDNIAKEPMIDGNYILAYILGEKDTITKFANYLGEVKSLPVYFIATIPKYLSYRNVLTGIGPDAFIGLIKNARYVVTDSYHGCLFCINYHIQFYAFSKRTGSINDQDNIRIIEFLQSLQLEDRFQDESHAKILPDHEYSKVEQLLLQKREASISYLEKCLQ